MALYKVETVEKKNVFIRTRYTMPDEGPSPVRSFYTEEWYRWGSCIVESDEPIVVNEDPYNNPFDLDEYDIEDQDADDGCSFVFVFGEEWTEEEKKEIEELWDNGDFYDMVNIEECETQYYGPLEVTEV